MKKNKREKEEDPSKINESEIDYDATIESKDSVKNVLPSQKKKKRKKDTIKTICITIIMIGALFFLVECINNKVAESSKYLVDIGRIEKTIITDAYIVRNEKVIDTDVNKTLIPIINEGKKVSKGSSVAFYKDESYDEKLARLNEVDAKIFALVNDLEPIYSSDIKNIENSIRNVLQQAEGNTSYTQLHETSIKIKKMLVEKTTALAALSDKGENIRNLLKEREDFNKAMLKSDTNINSPISGIVSYKIDGLEKSFNNEEDNTYVHKDIKESVEKNINKPSFGVKIVDNFSANLYVTLDKKDVTQGIKEGNLYKIRLLEKGSKEVNAKIVKISIDKNKYNIIFEINNCIEDLLDIRKLNCEIVWWSYEGLKLPNKAIYKRDNILYTNVVDYPGTAEVPIKVKKDNGRFSIIDNYTVNEKEELGLKNNFFLEIYDEIIINSKK
ncbi:MAG: HlyD family efflux transporter periplasmic adaptor subunit [Clostridia bacterium]